MRTFITNDGDRFEVATADDLVTALWRSARTPDPTRDAFVAGVAKRVEEETGAVVPTGDADALVAALVELGYVSEEAGNV
ncbi:MAG TPA: hypothetical protein VH854_07380 [Thermoanaerobaculia bacterium]|jgi:hypothetical protein|nr:hypothetical protein [Thermoanaerobaculia bacterium]